MITLTREEAQQVLDFIDSVTEGEWPPHDFTRYDLVQTLRARLSAPEPERFKDDRLLMQAYRAVHKKQHEPVPVAVTGEACSNCWGSGFDVAGRPCPFNHRQNQVRYTAPPQREWQGLTDEDVKELRDLLDSEWISYAGFARAIESKLKEKNCAT